MSDHDYAVETIYGLSTPSIQALIAAGRASQPALLKVGIFVCPVICRWISTVRSLFYDCRGGNLFYLETPGAGGGLYRLADDADNDLR